jgi:uroporphyrinogen decarboxylase
MTSKERVIEALQHKEPDRVPTGEMGVDYLITERLLEKETYYRAKYRELEALWKGKRDEMVASYKKDLVELTKRFGWDFVPVFLVPSKRKKYELPEFIQQYRWKDKDGSIFQYSPKSKEISCIKPAKMTMEDLERLEKETYEIDESELELVRYVVRKMGGTHFILGRYAGGTLPIQGLSDMWEIFGRYEGEKYPTQSDFEGFMTKMISDPEFVYRLIDIHTKRAIKRGKAMIKEGVDGVMMGCDYCDNKGPIMGPKYFRKFIFPSLKKHCEKYHAAGAYVIKHTDGNTWDILDMMTEAGIDGYQGIQLTVGMDIRELKGKYDRKLCLWGGVDCSTLIGGTKKDIRKETECAIRYGAPGGGLVLTSGNTIQVGAKYENYLTMLKTLQRKGTYPIRI